MAEFELVGELKDFPEGRGKVVKYLGKEVAIFNVGGRLHAIQDTCPHQGASLGDSHVRQGHVICHRHAWAFNLETGREAERTRCFAKIYEVKLTGEQVYLGLPPTQEENDDDDDDWPVWDDNVHIKPS